MNKLEMIDAIAMKTGFAKVDVEKMLSCFINITIASVQKGDRVNIGGFGRFDLIKRSAKKGSDPITRDAILINAKNAPKFTASQAFKEAVEK